MQYILPVIICYLLGSVSFSFLIGKWYKKIDIRQYGSGNAGATNTLRVLGPGPALLVLALDIGKGVLAVWIGKWFAGDPMWIPVLCSLAVIAGHNWPVFFGFRGGKGIATTIGVLATLCFWPALVAGIIAILTIVFTRYVSLGSLLFVTLTPVALAVMEYPREIIWASFAIFLFAAWRHRSNVEKIVRGEENKISFKKPKSKEE